MATTLIVIVMLAGWVYGTHERIQRLREQRRIADGRQRLHAQFHARGADGKCLCPYCRGDAEALAELSAEYELELWDAKKRLSELAAK
jgi:hypothetical protein